MGRAEDSYPQKKIKLDSTDDLRQMRLKTEEAYELRQKGVEAFVRNNHNDAVEFFHKAMEILRSLYDDDGTDCNIARLNLQVAMRAQEIAKVLPTFDVIKLKDSVTVVDPKSHTDAELMSTVEESNIIIQPGYIIVPELIGFIDAVDRQMILVIADLTSTVGCTEIEIGSFVEAKFNYMRANNMLESIRGDDATFSNILNLIKSLRDELSVLVSTENKDRPVKIDFLLQMAKNIKDNFTTLHFFLSAQPRDAGEQVQGT